MLKLQHQKIEIQIFDDPMFSLNSVDHPHRYANQHILSNDSHYSSKYGLRLFESDEEINSCLLVTSGGATGVHSQTAIVIRDSIFVAVGNLICSLELPSFKLMWHQTVDFATCFGVYYLPESDCLISHGEVDISRVTLNGNVIWSASGKDIFTEGFEIKGKKIEVIDFNHEKYLIDIEDGKSILLPSS